MILEASKEEIDAAAHEAATSHLNDLPQPTQAQLEAGNYRKGSITLHGLEISIENPKGSTRRGVSPDGVKWETVMKSHYGYIKGTTDKTGENIDVFIGDNPSSEAVFVLDQVDAGTRVVTCYADVENDLPVLVWP